MSKTIEKVTLRQFKGRDEAYDLGPLTLLVGPNSTGKTAVLEGVRYAITGATSAGATADACMKLMNAAGGSVALDVAGGPRWTRGLQKNLKTKKVTQTLVVDGEMDKTLRELDAYIAERCGDYAPTFDLAAFTSLSPDKRRDHVVQLCARHCGGAADRDAIMLRILDAWLAENVGIGTVNARRQAGWDSARILAEEAKPGEYRAMLDIQPKLCEAMVSTDTPTAVAEALDRVKLIANESKREATEARAAGRELSNRKAALGTIAESVEILDGQIVEQRRRFSELGQQIGRAMGQSDHKTLLERSIEADEESVETLKAEVHAVNQKLQAGIEDEPDALRAEADNLLADNPEPTREPLEVAEKAKRETDAAVGAAMRVKQDAEAAELSAKSQLDNRISRRKSADSDPWQRVLQMAKDIDETIGPLNPDARGILDAFVQDLIDLAREQISDDVGELDAQIEEASATHDKALAAVGKARIDHENAQLAAVEADKAVRAAYDAQREARIAHDEEKAKANQLRERASRIETDREYNTKLRDGKQEQVDTLEARIIENRKKLDELRAEMPTAGVEDLQKQKEGLDAAIRELEQKRDARQKLTTLDAEYAKCIESAERKELMHEVAKSLADAIRVVREELMAEMVRPLVGRIERFLSSAIGGDVHVAVDLENDRGKPIFELYWLFPFEGSHRKVSLEALGGGEAALFSAALAFALVDLSPTPLKLLMLECAELDGVRMPMLMRACEQCCGEFANVILATCHTPDAVLSQQEHGNWRIIFTDSRQPAEVAA